ncbi:MAG TPA: CehA/McbA family metallohydrolase [Kofleriaceae bacterium]
MGLAALAIVLSTMHYEGDVTAAGGDYVDVPFEVPAGTVEIQITHTDGNDFVILDWGVWGPDGFRGWGGGLTDDAIIGVDQSSRSYLPGPIKPGTWTVSIGKAKLDTTGGHYSIDVVCRDNATLAVLPKATYTPAVLKPERRWYKGDFHVHSFQSGDATATFDEISALATTRGLDFLNISDHNTYSQHALLAAYQPSQPNLLFLRGAEITTYTGHTNSVGTSSYVEHRLGYMGRTVAGIADDVAAQGGVMIVNHPVLDLGNACIGCQWSHVDDTPWEKVSAIELITGNFDIGVQAFVPRVITLWDSELDQGHRIAVVGGSDDHRAGMDTGPTSSSIGSPTTLVLADSLSETAIVEAVRKGRTIVQLRGPDDPFVEFKIDDAEIGDEISQIATVHASVHVVGGDGMFVQLWRNGIKLEQKAVTGADATVAFSDSPGDMSYRYRVELINDLNQRVVVTSHIYVNGVADGCGCRTNGSRGWPGVALIALAWLLATRRTARSRRR